MGASKSPSLAFELAALTDLDGSNRAPIGIFRDVDHLVHDDEARKQLTVEKDQAKRIADLQTYITGKDTWKVEA